MCPGCPCWDEDAGGSDRCLKVSREQHRSRCACAAGDRICCSDTDGQGQQPWEQPGWESLSLRRAAAVPAPGDFQDQLHSQEQWLPWEAGVSSRRQHMALTPTAMLSVKFKAICSNPPILPYQEGFCLLMLPKFSPWEDAPKGPLAQELQDFGSRLFISVRFHGAQDPADSLPFQRMSAVQAPGGIKQDDA